MLVVMAGLPGTGKSTIGQVLASRLGLPVVAVDSIETAILQAGIESDQPTGLAAYLVAETLAEQVLVVGGGVMIDAVNAVIPAREQWINLAARTGEDLRFVEVVCSDPELHRSRIEGWRKRMPHIQLTWNAVEQSLDEYAEWSGASADVLRITLDSVDPLGVNIDKAVAFLGP
jgi:predicted kinase